MIRAVIAAFLGNVTCDTYTASITPSTTPSRCAAHWTWGYGTPVPIWIEEHNSGTIEVLS
jgi:hypothetical protein